MKKGLGINVFDAAKNRIKLIFDEFPKIYLSYSGGKDSTVMIHMVLDEARDRGRKIGVLFVDLEAQYNLTIEHISQTFEQYADVIEPYWVCLPLHLRNAVSQFEPHWICWDPDKQADWVRQPPKMAITDSAFFPFFKVGMEFEEFISDFGHWYSKGMLTCSFVGIRSDESLNRYRTVTGNSSNFEGHKWTTWKSKSLYNAYPIYDWRTEDIWRYHAKFKEKPYNRLYDRMHQAGLSIHQARICQPYGDDQRKGLWLYQVIEPETWGRVVARVNGANQGALYAQESGNILGRLKVTKPESHSWQSFAEMLLDSMPPKLSDHYRDKIAVFLRWYQTKGYMDGIPDEADPKAEADKSAPSWRRICKSLLRNDYWCKGLSFTQTKSPSYEKYKKIMKKRREKWNIYSHL